jgi:hypothetical protein
LLIRVPDADGKCSPPTPPSARIRYPSCHPAPRQSCRSNQKVPNPASHQMPNPASRCSLLHSPKLSLPSCCHPVRSERPVVKSLPDLLPSARIVVALSFVTSRTSIGSHLLLRPTCHVKNLDLIYLTRNVGHIMLVLNAYRILASRSSGVGRDDSGVQYQHLWTRCLDIHARPCGMGRRRW